MKNNKWHISLRHITIILSIMLISVTVFFIIDIFKINNYRKIEAEYKEDIEKYETFIRTLHFKIYIEKSFSNNIKEYEDEFLKVLNSKSKADIEIENLKKDEEERQNKE